MNPFQTAPYAAAATEAMAFSGAEVIWHERYAGYAAVLSALPDRQPWYHLLTSLSGEWMLVASSLEPWIAFDLAPRGVLLDLAPVGAAVGAGRIEYGGRLIESAASQGFLCSAIWDVEQPARTSTIRYRELLVGRTWEPCIAPCVPATAPEFAAAYIRYGRSRAEEDWWACHLFYLADPEEKLRLILAVLDGAALPGDEPALGLLGAGPLEDMLGDWLVDLLEDRIRDDPRLRYALSMVRLELEPAPLQARLRRLMGAPAA